MVINEKTKIRFIILILIILTLLVVNFKDKTMQVKIIYFRRTSCVIIDNTDRIIEGIKNKLGDKVKVRIIDLDDEENLSEEDRKLRDKYEVVGVPEIIINGKEYTKEFTKDKLEKEICSKFLIKPEGCK